MSRRAKFATWVLLLLGLWLGAGRQSGSTQSSSLALRLFGPISDLAARWQWVRVRQALDDRSTNLAYARAEIALELDPTATAAWSYLAAHMANDRASPFRQRNAAARGRWIRAALDVLARGEAVALQPEELAMHAGSILIRVSEYEGQIPWPGGPRQALLEAGEHFERATRLGPENPETWVLCAAHRGIWMSSVEVQEEPEERVASLRRGLAILDEAEAVVERLGPIHFQRGVILGLFADEAPESDVGLWEGGRAELYRSAIRAFELAEGEGYLPAADGRRGARAALESLEGG